MGYKTDEIINLFREFSKEAIAISPKYMWESIKETKDNNRRKHRKNNTKSSQKEKNKKYKRYKNANCYTSNRFNL